MSSGLYIATLTGSALALVVAGHCAVMCGPLALAARVRGGAGASAAYFVGRLVSYTLLGALAGGVGHAFLASSWARWAEAILAWALGIALLATGIRTLRATRGEAPQLVTLGKRPRASTFGRVLARVADDPLLLGVVTAILPCGALFSAVTASAALGSAGQGALAMASFAVVSGLCVVGVAQLGALGDRGPVLRRAVGCALLVGAAITIYRPIAGLRAQASAPSCHQVSAAPAHGSEH